MKLTRLRVAELRRFRAPFELAQIQPGLNIFSAANEAGKSTLVRAIRAAFFERHKSSSVDDLRPYDDSAAAPEVELDFEIAGVPYRLAKRFLKKMRCDLVVGTQRLEGVDAEDALAERLGFQFALKGASREAHWGIPGLLWIEQGSAHTVRDAVVHAADHLRKALDESLGEVSASGGDEVVAQVRQWRDELLTGTGKPKAGLLKAVEDATALEARVAQLQQSVAAYRGQVDQLELLRNAHAADASAQPWVALRAQRRQVGRRDPKVRGLTLQADGALALRACTLEQRRQLDRPCLGIGQLPLQQPAVVFLACLRKCLARLARAHRRRAARPGRPHPAAAGPGCRRGACALPAPRPERAAAGPDRRRHRGAACRRLPGRGDR